MLKKGICIFNKKIGLLIWVGVMILPTNGIASEKTAKDYIEDISSKDERVVNGAIEYLYETHESYDPTIIPALMEALKDKNACIRAQVSLMLAKKQVKEAVPTIIGLLQDNDDDVRRSAASFLADMVDERAVGALVESLKDNNEWVRCYSAEALGKIVKEREKNSFDIGTITFIFLSKTDLSTGTETIELNQIKQSLINLLNDKSPFVRKNTIRALGNFEDPGFIPIIRSYLNDPYSETREKTKLRREAKKTTVVKLGKVTIYPVREEAQRVIKLLEEKKKQEEKEGKKAPKGKKESQEGVNDKKGKK